MIDEWGAPVSAADDGSVAAWNTAWGQALHFVDDPFETLAAAIEHDDSFALGSVFCGTYRLLGGMPADSSEVMADIEIASSRASDPRERAHVDALKTFAAGNFTDAARQWDEISALSPDFAAIRFAHDVYLHVGNIADRLRSSSAAMEAFEGAHGWNLIASQYAFSLEEAGEFADAEGIAYRALEADPMDLWATHALAHMYEHTQQLETSIELLRSRQETWAAQDGLAVHVWWHLTLHLMALGRYDEVLAIHDDLVPVSTTPFRLCDLASMLWRLELNGVDVGDRWENVADAFASRTERHTCGFLDLHMAMAFTRCPDHSQSSEFFDGVTRAHGGDSSENATTFRDVVVPLVDAIRTGAMNRTAVATLDRLEPVVHRIGGSNAQREIVDLTTIHFRNSAPEAR